MPNNNKRGEEIEAFKLFSEVIGSLHNRQVNNKLASQAANKKPNQSSNTGKAPPPPVIANNMTSIQRTPLQTVPESVATTVVIKIYVFCVENSTFI